jgi:hypothetical protein
MIKYIHSLMSKSYLLKVLSMLYDLNGSKPHLSLSLSIYIYIYFFFVCQNLSICHIYISSIGPMSRSFEYLFLAVSKVFGTTEAVLTGHVRHMAQTYPASWTCLGLGFLAYIMGLSAP